MVRVNKMAVIFYVFLVGAFIIALHNAVRVCFPLFLEDPPGFGVNISIKVIWVFMASALLLVLVLGYFLVRVRDEGRIPDFFKDLQQGEIFEKEKVSPELGLTEISNGGKETLIFSNAPADLPKRFVLKKGEVFASKIKKAE